MLFIAHKVCFEDVLTKHIACHSTKRVLLCKMARLFYLSERYIFPRQRQIHRIYLGKIVPEPALRPSLPHAPGVRMTVVHKQTPSNYRIIWHVMLLGDSEFRQGTQARGVNMKPAGNIEKYNPLQMEGLPPSLIYLSLHI